MAITAIKEQGGNIHEKKKKENLANKDNKITKAKKSKQMETSTIQNGKSDQDSETSSESDSEDSDFDENEHYPYRKQKNVEKEGYEEVPANANVKAKKRPILTPEELALGQELISSKKRRRELEDAAWNRYMFDDKDK